MPDSVEKQAERKLSVLVVDDEQIILNITTDALKSEGYAVEAISNPHLALERLTSCRYDFLLTDIKMPGMDGMTLVKEAHKIDPDLAAIFMTGYASLDTAKEAIKAGAYDYIMKPFELAELRRAMAKAVDKKLKQDESSGKSHLSRLSDLMEVLYNVGDREGLLKLSLGLALLNCNLRVGLIAAWNQRTAQLHVAATDDVKAGNFRQTSLDLPDAEAEKSFPAVGPARKLGVTEHSLFVELGERAAQLKSYTTLFSPQAQTVAITIKNRKQFYATLVLQQEFDQPLIDRDLKLLSIVLSLVSLAAENIALFEESRQSLTELEKLHDEIVNLEKVATKGVMSAEIGHELNNFLSIVKSNFELLRLKARLENAAEVEKYLIRIDESLELMTKFTTGLTDAAKLRTEKKEIDLNLLVEDTVSFLAPQKRFRKIGLVKELDPRLPRMQADPGQLTQVFYNLLNNAADALREMPAGAIKITTQYLPDEHEVLVHIADNGPGIPEEYVRQAFSSRFTTKTGGHGFGLLVCSRVVANHGGRIEVARCESGGTVFRITLPLISKSGSQPITVPAGTSKIRV